MTFSESFDASSEPSQYELIAETEFFASPAFDSPSLSASGSNWQEQLLPLSCVSQEDNLEVLRAELKAAHQLLQQQHNQLTHVTEQLKTKDLQLNQAQDELRVFRQANDGQTARMSEVESICKDLKMQLRRQQQRVLQYRSLLSEVSERKLDERNFNGVFLATAQQSQTKALPPCNKLTEASEANLQAAAAKAPPVSAWSAPDSIGLTGPLACYRKLANIRMTASSLRREVTMKPLASVSGEGRHA
ncbi:MAG TPA: hypothetical protein V6D19_01355, partial [Stenomitos sp.]